MVEAEDVSVLVGELELFLLYCLLIHIVFLFASNGFGLPSKCLGLCVMYTHNSLI